MRNYIFFRCAIVTATSIPPGIVFATSRIAGADDDQLSDQYELFKSDTITNNPGVNFTFEIVASDMYFRLDKSAVVFEMQQHGDWALVPPFFSPPDPYSEPYATLRRIFVAESPRKRGSKGLLTPKY